MFSIRHRDYHFHPAQLTAWFFPLATFWLRRQASTLGACRCKGRGRWCRCPSIMIQVMMQIMHMQMQKHMQDKGHVMSVSKKSKIVVHSMCYVKVPKYTTCAKFRILGPDDGRSWHAGDGEARSVCNSLSSSYFTNTFSSLSLSLSQRQRQRQSLSTTSLCAATTPPLHNFGLNFQCVGLVLSFLSPLALVFCWSGNKRSRT